MDYLSGILWLCTRIWIHTFLYDHHIDISLRKKITCANKKKLDIFYGLNQSCSIRPDNSPAICMLPNCPSQCRWLCYQGCAMHYHVHVMMHAKDSQLFLMRVEHSVIASPWLSLYDLVSSPCHCPLRDKTYKNLGWSTDREKTVCVERFVCTLNQYLKHSRWQTIYVNHRKTLVTQSSCLTTCQWHKNILF